MKYILYVTINIVTNEFYVGVHELIPHKKFDGYLGNGVYATIFSTYKNGTTKFKKAVNKYGPKNFKRITLYTSEDKEEIYDLERLIVNPEFLKNPKVYNRKVGGLLGDESATSKKCYQYDLKGVFITEYSSQQKAAKELGVGYSTIKNGIKNKYKVQNYLFTDIYYESVNPKEWRLKEYAKKPVYFYNQENELVASFNSISDASKVLNTSNSNIKRAFRNQSAVCGLYVKFDDGIINKEKNTNYNGIPRKVGKYTLEGELVKVYNTVTACKKEHSGCQHVLSGARKTSGGFIFKYISNSDIV